MTDVELPLPTFLIIGAQKSATRWLRVHLGEHPQIFTARSEAEFFDRHFDDGVNAYRQAFVGWDGPPFVGESTPGYMMWRNDPSVIAARIQETLSDVKLLAILRDPVDRAFSAFCHHISRGRLPVDARLLDVVRSQRPETDPLSLISGGWYAASLEPYIERFGDRLLVVLHDAVHQSPHELYRSTVAHVGADPAFLPRNLEEVLFSTEGMLPAGASGTETDGIRRQLRGRERMVLYEYFADEIVRLEKLLGLDLARWKIESAA